MVVLSSPKRESEHEITAATDEMIARTVLGESSVWGLLGYRRKGKGVYGSVMCWQAYLKGVRILHLGNLTFGEQIDPIDLAAQNPGALGNCLLFVDESRLVLPSVRSGTIFQLLVASNLVQSGHQGLSILWTAQFERGVSRDITEQTDWILNINSAKRRWTTDRQIKSGKVRPEQDNRCDAWRPESDFHKAHTGFAVDGVQVFNDCREMPQQFTIAADIVTQWGNPLGPGRRETHTLHCAQRFFPLSKTAQKIDAMGSLLISSDQLRDQDMQAQVAQIRKLLVAAHEKRYGRVVPSNLADYLQANIPGLVITPNKLTRILGFLGVPMPRTSKQRFYDLDAWDPGAAALGSEPDESSDDEPDFD